MSTKPPLVPEQLSSYIAVGADGAVSAFFGKMDMGQGLYVSIGQIVASESFESVKPAASEAVPDIVQSFDDAVGAVLKRAVMWTLKAGEENKKNRPKDWD